MVKSFNQKENQKKKPKKKQSRNNSNKRRRNFPKIRRSLSLKEKSTDLKSSISSRNSETDFCLNISIVNWASIFLEKIKLPKKLHKEFFNNLKILKFTENEFVEWIMYLDDYIEQTKNYDDLESFFYLGLLLKKSLGTNLSQSNELIKDKEKFAKVNEIFKNKTISVNDFNKKFNDFKKYSQQKKTLCYDINSMIDFICAQNKKPKKKDNKGKEEDEKDIQANPINQVNKQGIQAIPNNPINSNNQSLSASQNNQNNFNDYENNFGLEQGNDEQNDLSIILYKGITGIDGRDNEPLPNEEYDMERDKLASSYENLRNDYILSTMLDFKKKNW